MHYKIKECALIPEVIVGITSIFTIGIYSSLPHENLIKGCNCALIPANLGHIPRFYLYSAGSGMKLTSEVVILWFIVGNIYLMFVSILAQNS